MAFIDVFNYKKYFKKSSDATVARVGHVNALYDAAQPKFTVDTVTQTGANSSPVTINSVAGRITMASTVSAVPSTFRVDNSEVKSTSIIILTVEPSSADALKELLVRPYSVVDGSFTVAIEIAGLTGATNAAVSINFLVINP